MALTRITKGVIKPNENYDTHNINSTGIVTAIGLDVNGNGDISGNLSVGGVLTYEDVTSIDSVGIITAQKDIHVGAGISVVGIVTAATFKGDGDFVELDVDGHTNLDNVSVSGVLTATSYVGGLPITDGANNRIITASSASAIQGEAGLTFNGTTLSNAGTGFKEIKIAPSTNNSATLRLQNSQANFTISNITGGSFSIADGSDTRFTINSSGVVGINNDLDVDGHTSLDNVSIAGVVTATSFKGDGDFVELDVDGHTNLDNVSIAGVTTFAENINLSDKIITNCKGFNTGNEQARIVVKAGNNTVGGGLRIVEYYNDDTTLFSSEIANFYTNGIELKEDVSISGITTVSGASLQLATADLVFLNNNHKIHNQSSAGNVTIQGGPTYAGGRIVLSGGYASGGGTGDIKFYADTTTTPVERLRITSDGQLELRKDQNGVTGRPDNRIVFYDTDTSVAGDQPIGEISWYSSDSGMTNVNSYIRGINEHTNGNGALLFGVKQAGSSEIEAMRISSLGRIGIGTDNPVEVLHVLQSGTTSADFRLENSEGSILIRSDNNLAVYDAQQHLFRSRDGNTEYCRITSDGKFLIGDTADTNAHANADDLIIGNTNSGKRTGITLVSATDKDGNIHFSRGTSSSNNNIKGQIVYVHASGNSTTADSLNFYTNADHRLRIDQNGDVFIGTTTDIAPTNGTNLCVSDGTIARLVLEKQSTRKFSLGAQDHFNIYDETASSERYKITSTGASQFTGNDSSTISHQFYNSNSGSGADNRLLIKTYANAGADPYIKFDSGGTNMVVGQLYSGGSNNKLVLGAGESPSGGVTGIHVFGDGDVHMDQNLFFAKSSDPRIYSGSSVGLNIDGMALYLNRNVNSSIAMGNGGGGVSVSNATSGNDAQFNIYKSTGSNSDKAILRVGYNADYCYSISRQRNSGSIVLNQTQAGGIAHHQNTGDDTMILTNRNSVHIAKLAPMVIQHAHTQSSASWGGSRPYKFYLRYSTGNFSGTYHVCRMISQHDWGHQDWEATVYHDYYSPSSSTGSTHRYTGYYGSHTDQVKHYNQQSSGSGTGNGNYLLTNQNLGPGGAFKIHESANGGYYRDAYATDYYVSLGNYSGVTIEIRINNPQGHLKDQATTLTDFYPAAFNGSASQSDADSWSYGRGLWFNVRPGVLDSSWWGYSSNFGQQTLPTS